MFGGRSGRLSVQRMDELMVRGEMTIKHCPCIPDPLWGEIPGDELRGCRSGPVGSTHLSQGPQSAAAAPINSSTDGEVWVTLLGKGIKGGHSLKKGLGTASQRAWANPWCVFRASPALWFQNLLPPKHEGPQRCPWVLCQMRVEGDLSAGWKKS